MNHRRTLLSIALLVVATGCRPRPQVSLSPLSIVPSQKVNPATLPALNSVPGVSVAPNVLMYEVNLPSSRGTSKVRVYLPNPLPTGRIPCVFVAPAGTPLIYGNALGPFGEGDEKEQIPYAQAGFAVVAYSIDGDVKDPNNDADVMAGMRAFRRANGGIENTREAIDYAVAHVPDVDPKRLYVAGHSSAATLAIQAAENDSRIAACAAYAPATHFKDRFGGKLDSLELVEPGITDFLASISPVANVEKLRCPLFLFHADDDSNVPLEDNQKFADAARRTNHNVTFVRVPSGGHYQSMIDEGIPRAIEWFNALR
jgi:dipeptidyl aminopeptidase/acylaminoacyl peptidase